MTPDVLAILITVRNANAAIAQINGVRGALGEAAAQARLASIAFRVLALATVVLLASLRAAGQDETMYLQLQAITHSAAIAQSQMQAIRRESDQGLFNKDELFQARKIFDETGASISKLLPLAEELSLRSGKGLDQTARVFASLSGGGIVRLGAVLRAAGLTVDALRGAGIDVTRSFEVKGSPQEIIAGLGKLLGQDSLTGALGGSLSAETKGLIASLTDLFRSLGAGLIPIVKPALEFLTAMLKTLTYINDITHGWLGNILLAVGALKTLSVVIPIIRSLAYYEKIAAVWATVLMIANNPWGSIAAAISAVVVVIKALADADKIAAAWTAILDALSGNWTALIAGAVVAGAVGVAWHFGNQGGDEQNAPAAEQPTRRSDIENQMNRARARAWA